MATEKRLIDANELQKRMFSYYDCVNEFTSKSTYTGETLMDYEVAGMIEDCIDNAPTVDAVEVVHGQRLYNAHEVAEIIADLFGDSCACNFNSIDEWLPFKCELQAACPNPVGVACWEQYLKFRYAKIDGDGNED